MVWPCAPSTAEPLDDSPLWLEAILEAALVYWIMFLDTWRPLNGMQELGGSDRKEGVSMVSVLWQKERL